MECNRDEAKRAKEIAETKLSMKDIAGAQKFALKAQNLYPGLDGISQLLATLDVYVAAENKINGELDLYGILGVSPLADEDTLRKHYRKLALSLHPDKNKSIGADEAFKYVSEAWSLLSDKVKRSIYDHKRNAKAFKQKIGGSSAGPNGFYNFTKSTTTRAKGTTKMPRDKTSATTKRSPASVPLSFDKLTTCPVSVPSSSGKQTVHPTSVPLSFDKLSKRPGSVPLSSDKQTMRRTSIPPSSDKQTTPVTFWTVCHGCRMQYEYLRMYLCRKILCQTCNKPYVAIETPPPNINDSLKKSKGTDNNVSKTTNQKPESEHLGASSNPVTFQWGPFSKIARPASVAHTAGIVQRAYETVKREREDAQAAIKKEEASMVKKKLKKEEGLSMKKKSKKEVKFSPSGNLSSEKSKQDAEDFGANKETGDVGVTISSGFKQGNSRQVDATKDVSSSDIKNRLMKKAKTEIQKKLTEWSSEISRGSVVEEEEKVKEKTRKRKADTSANGDSKDDPLEPLVLDVPDPDFHDFDQDRTERAFEGGQVWAAYDEDDGMPRSYAMIRKVLSFDPFKLKISWLNSKTNNEPGLFSGLSWAVGEFKTGKHEIVSSPNYFSHKVSFTKGANGAVHVHPRKGDVWALYRNWSPEWNDQTPRDVIYKYEIVEVDEYNEETGFTVTPLVKVAGFKTVFHRQLNPIEARVVSKSEFFQFSHRIPSFLLTGRESPNAPKGCRELDPASTPLEFLEVIADVIESGTVDGDDEEASDKDKSAVLADFKEAKSLDLLQ